jgi:O-antigen/teichoic acid export membrane protein
VIGVLAVGSLIQGFENIGVVAFRKEMRFDLEFRYQLARKLAMVGVTVPLAFVLRSYWALVAGIVAGKALGVAYSYYAHPYRPRFTLAARGELLGFSQWLLLNNVVMFLRDRLSDFVIGRLRGPAALGVYSLGYEIANMPTVELAMPINRAVYPGYARLHQKEGSLREGFLAVIGLIALLAIPAGAGVSATAEPLTAVILGAKWMQAVPLIEILAFFGVIMALQTNSYSVFLAIGRPYLQSVVLGVYLAALLPLLILLTRSFGLEGAAWACLASVALMLPVNYALVIRALDIELRALARLFWRPVLAAAVMYAVVTWLLGSLPHGLSNPLLRLVIAGFTGAALYFASVFFLWSLAGRPAGAETLVLQRLGRAKNAPPAAAPAKE